MLYAYKHWIKNIRNHAHPAWEGSGHTMLPRWMIHPDPTLLLYFYNPKRGVCLHPIIYIHLLQARVPANEASVPALYYLHTFVAGTCACKRRPCACTHYLHTFVAGTRACTSLFTHICCRHVCLHTINYIHLLQARVLTFR